LPGLVEAFGLILVWLTRKLQENSKKTPRKRLLPLTISLCIRRLSQESVQWSRAWGRKFSISFSLQLLISWLAPSWCLDLTNGLPGDHSALWFSSVAGIGRSLLIDFGLVDKKTTRELQENTKKTPITFNDLLVHQKIEPSPRKKGLTPPSTEKTPRILL
jgi:hypothetical protein